MCVCVSDLLLTLVLLITSAYKCMVHVNKFYWSAIRSICKDFFSVKRSKGKNICVCIGWNFVKQSVQKESACSAVVVHVVQVWLYRLLTACRVSLTKSICGSFTWQVNVLNLWSKCARCEICACVRNQSNAYSVLYRFLKTGSLCTNFDVVLMPTT